MRHHARHSDPRNSARACFRIFRILGLVRWRRAVLRSIPVHSAGVSGATSDRRGNFGGRYFPRPSGGCREDPRATHCHDDAAGQGAEWALPVGLYAGRHPGAGAGDPAAAPGHEIIAAAGRRRGTDDAVRRRHEVLVSFPPAVPDMPLDPSRGSRANEAPPAQKFVRTTEAQDGPVENWQQRRPIPRNW